MGVTEVTDYYDGYLNLDFADVVNGMLANYNEDDLTELLCECEMLLQTNRIYLNKLSEKGFKRLFNIIAGIERNSKRRLRDNFQMLHEITLAVEKNILSRFKDLTYLIFKLREKQKEDNFNTKNCINFLMQKINDHKRAIDAVNQDVNLIKWELYGLNKYASYSNTKKVLQIVSDIYAITGGSCECKPELLESALKKLGVSNIEISPVDFAKEVMQDLECLPLYIKDRENYYTAQTEVSGYGSIIYQVSDLVMDQNIQELAAARNETVDNLCLPLLRKSIEEKGINVTYAPSILWQLLEDTKQMNPYIISESSDTQVIEDKDKKGGEDEVKEPERHKPEMENLQKYSLLLISPSKMLECSLGRYMEYSFEPTYDYCISENNMENVKRQISAYSPMIIVKPDALSKADLVIGNSEIHTVSVADFYFCLWYKNQGQDKNIRNIALLDYYNRKLYVSCYKIEDTDRISKKDPFTIKYNRAKQNILKDIKEETGLPERELVLYRIFESGKYIDKKLGKIDVDPADERWMDLLENEEGRREVIDYLYEFNPRRV